MVLFGSFNCYCLIHFVKVNLSLALIHLNNTGKHIYLFFESSTIKGDNINFKKGAKHIVTTLPIFGRYLESLIDLLSKDCKHNTRSAFKLVNKNVIKLEKVIVPLTSISKFTNIFIAYNY